MKNLTKHLMGAGMAVLLVPCTSNAQIFKKLAQKAEQGLNKAADKAIDSAVYGKKTPSKTNAPVNTQTNTAPATNNSAGNTAPATVTTQQVETYSKYDFVPGDKVIYAEEFAGQNVGELPAGWNSNANGVLVTTNEPKGKWLQLNQGTYLTGSSRASFGKDYTIEFDVLLNVTPKTGYYMPPFMVGVLASGKSATTANEFLQSQFTNNSFEFKLEPYEAQRSMFALRSNLKNRTTFTSERKPMPFYSGTLRNVAHYAITVQGSRLRMWINENKVIDVPRAVNIEMPMNQLYFKTENTGGYNEGDYGYLISNIKIASGYPDTRNQLLTLGKFVTTGVLFDVNADVIKPQSYGVLKEVAGILTENASLKIKIIGHTDADGNAAANLELSKKRAEAIKAYLGSQFSVAADRITTGGMGAKQPVGDNKTASGKAANRRVEFVKM